MKYSLTAQAQALLTLSDGRAVEAMAKRTRLRDSERVYLEGALLAAVHTLNLFAEHEGAIRELLRERSAKP